MNPISLTKEFIQIQSPTPEEAEFTRYVEQVLRELGWHVEQQPVEENRWNLFATPAADSRPVVVFCAHLDTVAPYVELQEDDEYIYGRGACDDKGVMAAMITAALQLADEDHLGIGLLFTVGEEVDSVGAKAANEHAPDSIRYTLIGEPTNNTLIVGQKGIYLIDIQTAGTSAHSAYPHLGESAVTKLLDILETIRTAQLPGDPELGETTVNISRLSGGDRYNVIPDAAGAGLLFRVTTSTREVEGIVREAVGDRGSIRELNRSEPQRMVRIPGYEQGVVAFGSDVPYLTNWGERLMLGPGDIHDAHTEHERISKHALQEAVAHYVHIAKYLVSH